MSGGVAGLIIVAACGCAGPYPEWERLSSPSEAEPRCLINAPDDADRLYLGTHGDGVHVSLDGGIGWTRLDGGEGLSVHALAHHDGGIYAATGRGLWFAEDNGGGLVHLGLGEPVWSLAVDVDDSLLLGTVGVIHRYDAGSGLEELGVDGLPGYAVTDLLATPEAVLAGTLGAGLYRWERGTDDGDAAGWRRVPGSLARPFNARWISRLALCPQSGTIHLGSQRAGAFRSTDGGRSFTAEGAPEYGHVSAFLLDGDDACLATAGLRPDGLYRRGPDGDWSAWEGSPSSTLDMVRRADGSLLVCTPDGGLYLNRPAGR